MATTVTRKGQVTIPKPIREARGLAPPKFLTIWWRDDLTGVTFHAMMLDEAMANGPLRPVDRATIEQHCAEGARSND